MAAEEGGLDAIWAADHLLYQPADEPLIGFWESWTLMSALAEATSRVELGHLVLAAPFRNPIVTAWMANTIDEVSGGRFVLGLGSGWNELEFRAAGLDFEHRVSIYEDTLNVIVPLLREGRVDYAGPLASGRAELRPPPRRRGGPPMLLASKGPRMQRLSARFADRWNTAWYGAPAEPFWERRDGLWAACDETGRDRSEIEINVGLAVVDEARLAAYPATAKLLTGDAERVADGLAAWREQGVAEVMVRPDPDTPAMVERIARAAEAMRRSSAIPA